jgi:hypothetical protein
MGFNAFPFRRKAINPGVSKETYPKTKAVRDNREAIEKHARTSSEYFDAKFEKNVERMFGRRSKEGVYSADLTEDERDDIQNFIEYASKRLAAGAVSSEMFHTRIEKGKLDEALYELAPSFSVGHDSMHAMMAYARTNGKSLVPAYTQLDNPKKLSWEDEMANLEESYVIAFFTLDDIAHRLKTIHETQGLDGEELVWAVIENWDKEQAKKNFKNNYPSPEYLRQHHLPEFVNVVRNLLHNIQQEQPDRKFAIHEFQRILQPLLERLRTSSDKA